MGQKLGGVGVPFFLGVAGSPSNTKWPGLRPTSIPSGIYLSPSSRLATTDIGRKLGAVPREGELGPHPTQCQVGRGLPLYQVASWPMHPFCHNRRGPKIGGLRPFLGSGARSPSSTVWPGPRPTSMPSAILIHQDIWPQQTWAKNWAGGSTPFCRGELSLHLTQCHLGRCLSPYQVVSWYHLNPNLNTNLKLLQYISHAASKLHSSLVINGRSI